MAKFPQTLIIGGSGLVATGFLELSHKYTDNFLVPDIPELDITNPTSVNNFFSQFHPEVVINFAAHTNLSEAEKSRGNRYNLPWQINVEGVRNVAVKCKEKGMFLIQISTDAVFPGTETFPGPYFENSNPPDGLSSLSWYGYTKLMGEKVLSAITENTAIIRISYPFGNHSSDRDFASKTLSYIRGGYPLFNDQEFTPTYIPDLKEALLQQIENRLPGIYHVACKGVTTPYKFGAYLAKISSFAQKVLSGSVDEYLKNPDNPLRPKLGGLLTDQTESKLKIRVHNWEGALDEFVKQ